MNSKPQDEADEEVKTCTTCRRDGTQTCIGCHDAPDSEGGRMYPTYYCSAECQKVDWFDSHRYACTAAKDRRALYRLGNIAQLAYYAFLEQFFEIPITKVEKEGNCLYLHVAKDEEKVIMPFPSKMFHNEEDKSAALANLNCMKAVGFVHVLVERMLGKIVEKVGRVDHSLKYYKRRVILISSTKQTDNVTIDHTIVQVTFNSGQVFAIDITGAQHGHPDPIIPWHKYAISRIGSIKAVKPLKINHQHKQQVSKGKDGANSAETREEEFPAVFGRALDQWQVKNGSVEDLLQSKEVSYQKKKAELLDFIYQGIKKQKAHVENNGRLRYRTPGLIP